MLSIMGNLCCGGDDLEVNNRKTVAGGPPVPQVMTPTEDERRRQALVAAEERARLGAVRGTQRTQPKPKPKVYENNAPLGKSGPDISDWN
ncbi:unnamed protein product [Chondrus crispus]|uniref:Uncharacterized protein n=1 Tax=Chondrus crispus TaxID=2769 RepID=R7QUI9_CHOCR|nr:unnamed protein product [Chondrus crispus]CDF41348.1 unnamed protein product [Chondrus crispus]|eukprot:XP_005711642.1 unnamed protein product [Chondrus crispus]